MATNQRELCRYFLHGACRFGSNCFNSHDRNDTQSTVCRYYLQGNCSYGNQCRYDHIRPKPNTRTNERLNSNTRSAFTELDTSQPSSTINEQFNGSHYSNDDSSNDGYGRQQQQQPKSYFEALTSHSGATSTTHNEDHQDNGEVDDETHMTALANKPLCPYYEKDGECMFNFECGYVHGDLCEYCSTNCLHPFNPDQQEEHRKECIKRVENDMNEAFQVQCSQDKQCGICMETVWEKENTADRRFGILINCNHIFCLPCIRKWRASKAYENKIVKACPECRVKSDFITPSLYWFEDETNKTKIIDEYKKKLKETHCRYFKSGSGRCPFGNKCFYLHQYPDGRIADDLPSPTQRRRLNRNGVLESFSDLIHIGFNYWDNDDEEGDGSDDYDEDDDDFISAELLELLGNANVLHRLQESDSDYSDLTFLELMDNYFSGH